MSAEPLNVLTAKGFPPTTVGESDKGNATGKRKRPHLVRCGDPGIHIFESRHCPDIR